MRAGSADYLHWSPINLVKHIVVPFAFQWLMHGTLIRHVRIVDDNGSTVVIPICSTPFTQAFPLSMLLDDFLYVANQFQLVIDVWELASLLLVIFIRMLNDCLNDLVDFFIR